MKTVIFEKLELEDQALLRRAAEQTARSLNKVSGPQVAAIIRTRTSTYAGNNIFLSNCTLVCAEASALAAGVAHGDLEIQALYLAVARSDGKESKPLSPCGNCRQMLHDFALLTKAPIKLFSTSVQMQDVVLSDSDELLPGGFKSVALEKLAG